MYEGAKLKNKYFIQYFAILLCLVVLFLSVMMIPAGWIRENVIATADYFVKHSLFEKEYPDKEYALIDNLADCYLVSVMVGMDCADSKLQAVFLAPYYQKEHRNINESLVLALEEGTMPNLSYGRYWHGAIIFLRPLFVFGDIVFARRILGYMMIAGCVLVLLTNILIKKYTFSVVYFISCVYLHIFYCSRCIEYVIPIVLINIMLLILTIQMKRGRIQNDMCSFMIFSGCVVSFFDFLTVETLFFTIPYLYYVSVRRSVDGNRKQFKKKFYEECKHLVLAACSFAASYGMTFLIKWVICGLFDKKLLLETLCQGRMRVNDGSLAKAICNNAKFLLDPSGSFPERYVAVETIFIFLILLFLAAAAYKRQNLKLSIMGILTMVPYIRFAFLRNHSQYHYFFTYRAQLVAVMFVLFCFFSFLRDVINNLKS